MAHLKCDCGNEYEIRDDSPKWAAPWIMCGDCFLSEKANQFSHDKTPPADVGFNGG
jgi:hypothetical protein